MTELFNPSAVIWQGNGPGKEYPALPGGYASCRRFIQMKGPGLFWRLDKPEMVSRSGLGPSLERSLIIDDLFYGAAYGGSQDIYIPLGLEGWYITYQVGVNKDGEGIVRWSRGRDGNFTLEREPFDYDLEAFSPISKIGYELSLRIRNRMGYYDRQESTD